MHGSLAHEEDRLSNLIGAFAVAAVDVIEQSSGNLALPSASDAAALNFIGHAPGLSIDFLAKTLKLSHPGTVRLVDRLVELDLVERRAGKDKRTAALFLSAAGKKQRKRLQRGRIGTLGDLLSSLSAHERETLENIVEKMLLAHTDTLQEAAMTCRYCDETACAPCPMDRFLEDAATT